MLEPLPPPTPPQPQELWENKSIVYKLPCLGYSATAAQTAEMSYHSYHSHE